MVSYRVGIRKINGHRRKVKIFNDGRVRVLNYVNRPDNEGKSYHRK